MVSNDIAECPFKQENKCDHSGSIFVLECSVVQLVVVVMQCPDMEMRTRQSLKSRCLPPSTDSSLEGVETILLKGWLEAWICPSVA